MARSSTWLPLVGVLVVALVVFFTNLGSARLFDDDEGKNSTCGQEMFARGDWLVPTFNQDLRTDKPILIYWLMLTSFHVFGVSEFAARFASAVLAVGTVGLTYALGTRLFRPAVGAWAGLMLATCVMFDVAARAATPDSTLIFFATLAMWLFVRYVPDALGDDGTDSSRTNNEQVPRLMTRARWRHFVPTYAAMGCAVLAKGPVGVVLPTSALVLYGLLYRTSFPTWTAPASSWRERGLRAFQPLRAVARPRAVWQAIVAMRPLAAFAVVGAVALPWYVAVGLETDGAWLAGFLGKHNVDRFLAPMEGHRGPIVYYGLAVIIGFFPWSIFLPLSLIELGTNVRRERRWNASYLFLACWAGFYLGFFSLAGTKLPSYVLPAYPALAIMLGAFVTAWLRDPARYQGFKLRAALASVPLTGVGMLIALPIVAYFVLPGEGLLGLIGLILLVGGAYAYWAAERGQTRRAAGALIAACVLFAVAVFDFAAPHVGQYQNSWALAAAARQHAPGDLELATFDYFTPSLVYYANERIERMASPEDAAKFLREHPHGYLVTRNVHLESLAGQLPADVTELARQRRFLRSGEVVLLGRPAQTARRATAGTVEKN